MTWIDEVLTAIFVALGLVWVALWGFHLTLKFWLRKLRKTSALIKELETK